MVRVGGGGGGVRGASAAADDGWVGGGGGGGGRGWGQDAPGTVVGCPFLVPLLVPILLLLVARLLPDFACFSYSLPPECELAVLSLLHIRESVRSLNVT